MPSAISPETSYPSFRHNLIDHESVYKCLSKLLGLYLTLVKFYKGLDDVKTAVNLPFHVETVNLSLTFNQISQNWWSLPGASGMLRPNAGKLSSKKTSGFANSICKMMIAWFFALISMAVWERLLHLQSVLEECNHLASFFVTKTNKPISIKPISF